MKVNSTNPESFHSNKALTIDIKKPWITNHNLGKNETLLKITAWSVYIQSWKSEIPTWMLLSIHLQWDQPWAHHIQASAGKDPLKIDVTFNQWRGCGKETCWVFSFLGSRQRLWWPFGCNRLCELKIFNLRIIFLNYTIMVGMISSSDFFTQIIWKISIILTFPQR